jgi:hypothetical protein
LVFSIPSASVLGGIDNITRLEIAGHETKTVGTISYGTMFILQVGTWCELYYFNQTLDRLSTNTEASGRVAPSVDNYNLVLTNTTGSSYYIGIIWLRKR